MSREAIVVGAGFGGMAAAIRLRALGFDVTLIDRLSEAGGRGRSFRLEDFHFDAGPTVITAPFLFRELFDLHNANFDDAVKLVPLDPWYRIVFDDGKVFDYRSTTEATLAEIAKFDKRDCEGYLRLLKKCRKVYSVGFEELGDYPFQTPLDMIKIAPKMMELGSYLSVHQFISSYIRNDYLRQVFSFHPLLVGGNPFSTTSIYTLIHALEREHGVWYAMGGTKSIVDAMVALMERIGVKLRLGLTVTEMKLTGMRASSLRCDSGEEFSADCVVFNADPSWVYRTLMPKNLPTRWSERRLSRARYSMGLFVLYLCVDREYPELKHHTIILGPRYRGLIDDIFERGILADDMSLYLHAPGRTDSSLAPHGKEGLYVLSPVPNLRYGHDWSSIGDRYAESVIARLEATVCPELSKHIAAKKWIAPDYFETELLSTYGAGFSIQPTLDQSAFFRFHNKSDELANVYFVGAGTHPGAGLPGVITSAKTMERALKGGLNPNISQRSLEAPRTW